PQGARRAVLRGARALPAGLDGDRRVQDEDRGGAHPFQFFPEGWNVGNYTQILAEPTCLRCLGITGFGAVLFTLLSLTVNSMAAYAFARLEFHLKRTLWVVVITTMFIPGMTILLTSFIMVTKLRMLDTLAVLVLPG